MLSTLGRASSRLPAPEKLELLKGFQEYGALPVCWGSRAGEAGAGAGIGLASVFPEVVVSPAWPWSLRWSLVVEGRAGLSVPWLLRSWCLGPWHSLVAGGSLSPQGSSATPVCGLETSGIPARQPPWSVSRWLRCPESEPGNGSAVPGWRRFCPGQLGRIPTFSKAILWEVGSWPYAFFSGLAWF